MKKDISNLIKIVNDIDEKQKVKEICDYASDSFDKVIIIGMKKINNFEDYKIIGNHNDDKDLVWTLEAAKLSILNLYNE